MPLERMLAGRPRYTPEEISELSGVPIDELERQWRSIGLAVPNRDEAVMSREDLDAANRMRSILDAGLAPEQLAELGRTIAVAMSQFAAASRQVVGGTFVGDGGAEDEVSDRVAEGAGGLIPTVGPTLDYVYRRHLREQLRHAAFDEESGDRGGRAARRRHDRRSASPTSSASRSSASSSSPRSSAASPAGSRRSPARSPTGPSASSS